MSNENEHIKYYNKDNIEIPSVTTILKIYGKHLESWSNWLGKRKIDYKTYLNQKAEFGTYIHSVCEKYFSDKMEIDTHPDERFLIPSDYPNLIARFKYIKDKLYDLGYEPYDQEHIMNGDKYGGTADLLFYSKDKDDYILLDLKTSKNVYSTMYMQLMAYVNLLKEVDNINVSQVGILLITKDIDDSLFCKLYSVNDKNMIHYYQIFTQLLNIYYILTEDERNKLNNI